MPEQTIGHVVQVMGPVLDIRFPENRLPALNNAIRLDNRGEPLMAEVAQQIGDNVVRCIAMSSTDGMVRGDQAVDTGGPITVPVGEKCLGRVFNLLGQPIDEQPAPEGVERWPIHRAPPPFDEQQPAVLDVVFKLGVGHRLHDEHDVVALFAGVAYLLVAYHKVAGGEAASLGGAVLGGVGDVIAEAHGRLDDGFSGDLEALAADAGQI